FTREVLRMAGLTEVRVTRRQLGTRVSIAVHHTDADAARAMAERAFGTMEHLESVLSRHRTGTALDVLNTQGVLASPPAELVTVLRRAIHVARLTEGAFDPTVRPLVSLYEQWAA